MQNSPIVVEVFFAVPVLKVWQALTEKDRMKCWYFTINDFSLEPGTVFNFYESEKKEYHHQGKILDVEKCAKLSHTWTYPSHSNETSVLNWLLKAAEGGTKVTLIHEGAERFAHAGEIFSRSSCEAGWKYIVGEALKHYVEEELS